NLEGIATQTATRPDGVSVAAGVVADVAQHNRTTGATGLGSVGVVIGATVALADYGLTAASLTDVPVLAPGFGHQGARIEQLPELFGTAAQNVVVSASRSILSAGPSGIEAAIDTAAAEAGAACRA
ncbi:MAG: orotidine 5'-phosphate decarboxylase, partial [Leifsonia sp.]